MTNYSIKFDAQLSTTKHHAIYKDDHIYLILIDRLLHKNQI